MQNFAFTQPSILQRLYDALDERGRLPRDYSLQQALEPEREAPWRIAGEVLRTYIVCESGDGCVWLIDKATLPKRFGVTAEMRKAEKEKAKAAKKAAKEGAEA